MRFLLVLSLSAALAGLWLGCPQPGPTVVEGEGECCFEGEAGEGEGEPLCAFGDAGDPDKARVVLVGHAFTDDPAVRGTELRSLTLTGDALVDDGVRLDVHQAPARIAFVPSGEIALVLGEAGHLASVFVSSAREIAIVGELDLLPGADYGDLRIDSTGTRAYVTGLNVTTDDGLHVVDIACDGTLSEDTAAFFGIRLADSVALLDDHRAVLLGGQAVFDPVDDDDVRLLSFTDAKTVETGAFDIFHDAVTATRIAASADGRRAAVPNNSIASAESGDIVLLDTTGGVVTEADRVSGFNAASEALFSPDGNTLLVSQYDEDRVAVFDVTAGTLVEGPSVAGVGLAEQMDLVARGTSAGLVLVAATNQNGNVHLLRIDGTDLGSVDLGAGSENIPTPIAVQP